jgi:anti-sigma-K factor RskA
VNDDGSPIDLAAARERRVAKDNARAAGGSRRRWARPGILVAAAAAVVAVALTGVLLLRDTGTPQRRFDVALSATELAPGASGDASMIKTDSGWEIHLQATGLPRLDNGEFYQAWLRNADGVLVPIGSFNEGTDVTLWSGASPATFSTFTITKEAADGKQDSSGQRVMSGSAVEQH